MEYTKVASYKLTSMMEGLSRLSPRLSREIFLTSETLYHGIVVEVRLLFSNQFDNYIGATSDLIGFYRLDDPYAPKLDVWFRLSEYQYYYDIVRQETPVYFGYIPSDRYSFPNGSFYVNSFQLITYAEPTGEGSGERLLLRPVFRLNRTPIFPDDVQRLLTKQQKEADQH